MDSVRSVDLNCELRVPAVFCGFTGDRSLSNEFYFFARFAEAPVEITQPRDLLVKVLGPVDKQM